MTGLGKEDTEAATAIEERTVDSAVVGRVEMDDTVILLPESCPVNQFADRLPVFDFRKTYYIRHGAIFVGGQENRFRDAIALVAEMRPAREEVLHVPEHQQKSRFPVIYDRETGKKEQH